MKIVFQLQFKNTLGTLFLELFLRGYSEVFQKENHFKVNFKSRLSSWHINKNLIKKNP